MAIICRDVGFLFLQAPHTGSSAIGRALRKQLACTRLVHDYARDEAGRIIMRRKHQTLSQLLATSTISAEERSNLFVAAGVRNPFDLVVTEYPRGIDLDAPDDTEERKHPDAWLPEPSPEDFERFVRRRYAAGLARRATRRRRRGLPSDYTEGVDFIIRFERMQADLDEALRSVGVLTRVMIPVVNVTPARKGRHYREYYTAEARHIIERVWAERLGRWGYAFEANSG